MTIKTDNIKSRQQKEPTTKSAEGRYHLRFSGIRPLSTLKVLQDDRFDQEHRELLADVLLGDVDVYLRGGLDKSWVDGGKKSGNEKIVGIFRV